MDPSDSLPARRSFAFGLGAPPSPDVGRRRGSLLFRVELSSRALPSTPEASCVPPDRSATTRLPHAATGVPADLSDAVCCLRPDMIGSADLSPFGFLCHEAAGFTLSHWARDFAPLRRSHTAPRGLSTPRSDDSISLVVWGLLRGAPALAAAGLSPASSTQRTTSRLGLVASGRKMLDHPTPGPRQRQTFYDRSQVLRPAVRARSPGQWADWRIGYRSKWESPRSRDIVMSAPSNVLFRFRP